MGRVQPHVHLEHHLNVSHSQKRDTRSTPEDIRSRFRFYEDYRKVAEEYDREFNKRYDDDLNTSLIFVSLTGCLDAHGLIRITGWSVLRCHFRLHYRGQLPAPAGSK